MIPDRLVEGLHQLPPLALAVDQRRPFTLGALTASVFKGYAEPMRYAGAVVCVVFLVGLVALPFTPETKGKPLPE